MNHLCLFCVCLWVEMRAFDEHIWNLGVSPHLPPCLKQGLCCLLLCYVLQDVLPWSFQDPPTSASRRSAGITDVHCGIGCWGWNNRERFACWAIPPAPGAFFPIIYRHSVLCAIVKIKHFLHPTSALASLHVESLWKEGVQSLLSLSFYSAAGTRSNPHPLWKRVFSETAVQPHPKPCASSPAWTP